MKRFLLLLLFASTFSIQAQIGCMEKSTHLHTPYDTKNFHYVQCNHDCTTFIHPYNRCPECLHFHEARISTLVTVDPAEPLSQKPLAYQYNINRIIHQLARNQKTHKNIRLFRTNRS